jgi:hypothetical protein
MTKRIGSLSELNENILTENVAGKNITYYFLIHGLKLHEVYLTGNFEYLNH